jgi:lipoyl-dependent peroxiredoxin
MVAREQDANTYGVRMATTRTATTTWHGSLLEGSGHVELQSSGLGGFDVTWASRAEDPNGRTSPEELIGAAHSSCFSMALSSALAKAGTPPETLETTADVTFQPGQGITGVHLTVRGQVPGISADDFSTAAEGAKTNCPVSQALTGTTITLDASLA